MIDSKSNAQTFRVAASGVTVGRIVRITAEDIPIVDYPGNPTGPLEARVAIDLPDRYPRQWPPVLLAFENGDPLLPIVVGLVRKSLTREPAAPVRKLVFDAEEEILIQCGKSSILLRRDGKIIIKGGNVVSRASGTNKVQGGAVRLN